MMSRQASLMPDRKVRPIMGDGCSGQSGFTARGPLVPVSFCQDFFLPILNLDATEGDWLTSDS